jgi:hypothetical protein
LASALAVFLSAIVLYNTHRLYDRANRPRIANTNSTVIVKMQNPQQAYYALINEYQNVGIEAAHNVTLEVCVYDINKSTILTHETVELPTALHTKTPFKHTIDFNFAFRGTANAETIKHHFSTLYGPLLIVILCRYTRGKMRRPNRNCFESDFFTFWYSGGDALNLTTKKTFDKYKQALPKHLRT